MAKPRLMTEDYKHSYDIDENGAKAQIAGIQSVLGVSATELLARRNIAQRCVNRAREELERDNSMEALVEYRKDDAMAKPAWDVHRKIDSLPFNPLLHVFSFLKARMFLADSAALFALITMSKKALTSAYQRPPLPRDITATEMAMHGLLGASVRECHCLLAIVLNLLQYTLALRGACDELLIDLVTVACGLLIRHMQYILPLGWTFSEENYRWLINTQEHQLTLGLKAVWAVLSRSPSYWARVQQKVDVPADEITVVFLGYNSLAKERLGWTFLDETIQLFSIIWGYPKQVVAEVTSSMGLKTTEERAARQIEYNKKNGRHRGNDVHVCIECGKGGIDAAGEKLVSHCSFCRCEFKILFSWLVQPIRETTVATYCSRECQTARSYSLSSHGQCADVIFLDWKSQVNSISMIRRL